jgi:hypothetical protein
VRIAMSAAITAATKVPAQDLSIFFVVVDI